MVWGTRALAAYPLRPVCGLLVRASMDQTSSPDPVEAQSDWDLGNLEARSNACTLCHVPRVTPEWLLQCGVGYCFQGSVVP